MLRGDIYRFRLPKGVGHEQLWGVDKALTAVLGLREPAKMVETWRPAPAPAEPSS